MKKGFFILITVVTMLVWQCGTAWGDSGAVTGNASIYLEGSILTQHEMNSAPETGNNWGSGILGLEASVGRLKITTESFAKTVDGNGILSMNTKVGYAVIDNEFVRLEATLSYHNLEINDKVVSANSVDCHGYLYGLDLRLNLSERMVLETNVGYTNGGTWATATNDSVSILTYKLRCDWLVWQSLSFSAGYRYYGYRPNSIANAETNFNAMYLGLVWRFKNIELKPSDKAPVQVWGK